MSEPRFHIIAAIDNAEGIGKNKTLPWHLSADLKYFKALTTQTPPHAVIMGRSTWESLPIHVRPLPFRYNVILSRTLLEQPSATVQPSLSAALVHLKTQQEKGRVSDIFVIGGAQVFQEALNSPLLDKIYLTQLQHNFACDVFFPPYRHLCKEISSSPVQEELGIRFSFHVYQADSSLTTRKPL